MNLAQQAVVTRHQSNTCANPNTRGGCTCTTEYAVAADPARPMARTDKAARIPAADFPAYRRSVLTRGGAILSSVFCGTVHDPAYYVVASF